MCMRSCVAVATGQYVLSCSAVLLCCFIVLPAEGQQAQNSSKLYICSGVTVLYPIEMNAINWQSTMTGNWNMLNLSLCHEKCVAEEVERQTTTFSTISKSLQS